jgi:hypothetical protein
MQINSAASDVAVKRFNLITMNPPAECGEVWA